MFTPQCIQNKNTCITHQDGKYIKWACNLDTKKQAKIMAQKAKKPCKSCAKLVSPNVKYCQKCYYKFNTHWLKGKKLPKWWIKNMIKAQGIQENNHSWKGDEADYWSKHKGIIKKYGNPKRCEDCGIKGKKNLGNRWTIQWANISGKYIRDISDYKGLCTSCHKIFDGLTKTIEDYKHGSMGRYRKGCKCDLCKKAKSMHRNGLIKYSDIVTLKMLE